MLRMSLLGEQAIIDDRAGSVQVRSSRAVALVAFLAVRAGSPQSRHRIAGLLWPDSTDAQALTNLRRELPPRRSPRTGVTCCLGCTRAGCWMPGRTLSVSAWSCAT